MTTEQKSVVTAERFAQGMTWEEYVPQIGSAENLAREAPGGRARQDNSERFQRNIEQYQMKPEHEAALKALPRRKMLVIGEDWCPDVFRGAPVLARIAAAAGWEFRFFNRDENSDIMAEFLKEQDGEKFESIPAAVLYTTEHEYIGHWIERPRIANEHMLGMQKLFTKQEGESDDDMRNRVRAAYQALQQSDDWDAWRHATVDEIIEIAQRDPA